MQCASEFLLLISLLSIGLIVSSLDQSTLLELDKTFELVHLISTSSNGFTKHIRESTSGESGRVISSITSFTAQDVIAILSKICSENVGSHVLLIEHEREQEAVEILDKIERFEREQFSPTANTSWIPNIIIEFPNNNLSLLLENKFALLRSNIIFTFPKSRSNLIPLTSLQDKTPAAPHVTPVHAFGYFRRSEPDFSQRAIIVTANDNSTAYRNAHDILIENVPALRRLFSSLKSIGISANVMDYIRIALGFNMTINPSSDWLLHPVNGTWVGIGKTLRDGGADISVDQSIYVPFRAKFFTLLSTTFIDRVCLYFRQPPSRSAINIMAAPFARDLWVALVGTFVMIFILLILTTLIAGKLDPEETNRHPEMANHSTLSANEAFLWVLSFFTLQGWYSKPRVIWLRIIFFCGSLMGLVVYTAYSANLISIFATRTKPINTIEDFLRSGIPLYSHKNSPILGSFLRDNVGVRNWSKQVQQVPFDEGLALAFDKRRPSVSAFMTFSSPFYNRAKINFPHADNKYMCKGVTELPLLKVSHRTGMIVPKNSPFKESFNIIIARMQETGALHRIQTSYVKVYKPICDRDIEKFLDWDDERLIFWDLSPAFVLLLAGYSGALLVVIVEKLQKLCNKKEIIGSSSSSQR